MRYIDWNIKCYCDIEKIVAFLLEQVEAEQCIIALQEVMPERADYIMHQLGDKYSKAMNVNYVGEDGKEHPFLMGCYGVGITRMMAAAIEQ